MKVLRVIWWTIGGCLALGMILSGYGGLVCPTRSAVFPIFAMTFPFWVVGMIVYMIVSIWVKRWAIVLGAATMVVCAQPLWNYCPLNFVTPSVTPEEMADRGFTLLSYNILNFRPWDGKYGPDSLSETISYILEMNADMAALVECEVDTEYKPWNIKRVQTDSLKAVYPYHHLDGKGNSLWSKMMFRNIKLPVPETYHGVLTAYRVWIHSRPVTLCVVHMSSFSMNDSDKALYKNLTTIEGDKTLEGVRSQLLHKLAAAFRRRARQVEVLIDFINRMGGENVIVCGDFNDIPGCWAIRQLEEKAGLQDVYTQLCWGPGWTFFTNNMYFRIDHVLYRGDMRPVKMVRGTRKTSDHLPLLVDFLFNEK